MKNSSIRLVDFLALARAGVAFVSVFLALGAMAPRLAAQSFDFNAGSDAGWVHYALPAYGAPTYSFPNDGSGGKAYKIYAPPTGSDPGGMGNARAGSLRAEVVYTSRFSVGVDLLAWNASWRQEAGILYFLSNVGLGTTCGYAATYSSGYQQLYISSVTGEYPTTVAELGTGAVMLDPTHGYRLVVSSHDGSTHLFQLFDKAEPNSPWTSTIGQDVIVGYTSGPCGLFVFEQDYPSETQGAEATFDNYVATAPAAGTMRATVTDVTPPPVGKSTLFYPTVKVGILDRDTTVDTTSILLCLDGVWIPNTALTVDPQVHRPNNPAAYPRDFGGATVTYAIPTLLPWGSHHTNSIAFRDNTSAWQTNTWTWTTAYPYLFASNSLPVGSLSVRGFDSRMVQSDNGGVNLANSLDRAEQQLAIPPQIPIDRTATSLVQVLSWDKTGTTGVPGLCGGSYGTYINIAVESYAYLELTAGVHRFRVNSDDRAGLYSGVSLTDPNAQAIWENPGNTANETFEFVVEAAGLYPVRCLWEETGGGAHLYLSSVNLGDLSEVLINDPANPAGVVKAYYPLACCSAASVAGPYAVDATALNALTTTDIIGGDCGTAVGQMVTGGTFTVPLPAATRFYRLDGPRRTKITGITKSGANLVITYQIL